MKLNKREFLGLAGAAAIIPGGFAFAQEKKSVLRYGLSSLPRTTDPHFRTGIQVRTVSFAVYDMLFAVNDKFEVTPQMVDTWTVSDDKMTYNFTLRDGLNWHDDAPVTAEDCVLSIRRWGSRDQVGQLLMEATSRLEPTSEKSFVLELGKPFAFVIESLAKPGSLVPAMMPKRYAETPASKPVTDLIGSGPFKHVPEESRDGHSMVFVKNTEYVPRSEPANWASGGKVVNFDRLELIEIPDATTQLNALLNGEIDYIETLSSDLLPLVEARGPEVARITNSSVVQLVVRINHLQPPFNDLKVRRAFQLAVNQQDVVSAVASNPAFARPCDAVFGCGNQYESAVGAPIHDMDKALALIAESGVDLSQPIVQLLVANASTLTPVGEVMADTLRKLGFTVDQQIVDFPTFSSRRQNQGPISEGGWNIANTTVRTVESATPIESRAVLTNGTDAWWGWPEDAVNEDLRKQFGEEFDIAKRKELTDQIQARIYENVSYMPVGEMLSLSVASGRLENVLDAPTNFFWNISIKP
ncbi:MAG: ABC transporter substrate-binding protein [Rhizobiaceae bacterium]|nr:ABC transporter substrate-binding protein [Rhizobiaceae bacterium]